MSLSLKDLIIYAHFQINRAAIIQQFCVNKDLPEMKCQGTCHLTKTIEENQEQDAQYPVSDNKEKTNTVYVFDLLSPHSIVAFLRETLSFPDQQDGYYHLHCFNIFHPPQLS